MNFVRSVGAVCRAFSTTAARSQEAARAPIQVFGREGKYAHALFNAASKENVLDKMEGDLNSVADSIRKVVYVSDSWSNVSHATN